MISIHTDMAKANGECGIITALTNKFNAENTIGAKVVPLTDAAYVEARGTAARLAGPEGLLGVIAREKLAAIVTPSTGIAWKVDYAVGDRSAPVGGYSLAAVAGTPSITIPIGESRGMPFGLTFIGLEFS